MKDTYGFMEDVPTLIRISNSNKEIKPVPSLATLPPPLNDIDKSSKDNNIMLVSSPSSISVKKGNWPITLPRPVQNSLLDKIGTGYQSCSCINYNNRRLVETFNETNYSLLLSIDIVVFIFFIIIQILIVLLLISRNK